MNIDLFQYTSLISTSFTVPIVLSVRLVGYPGV